MSDFTKNWRVTHDEPLNYNERIINSACDIIEKQDKRIEELETAKTIGIQACDLLNERIKELEASQAQLYTACGKYQERIKELETEIQEVSNQLMSLYTDCNETARPEVYGTILGLHERLDKFLKSDT